MCTFDVDGAELTCDLAALGCEQKPSPGWMYAVKYASANGQFTAFGSCTDTPSHRHFCCKITDSSEEIARVTLIGRDEQEEPIGFRWQNPGGTVVKNFVPTHGDGTGAFAWGRGIGDIVLGSDYAGSDYFERLYGEGGNDTIRTHAGGGRALGGPGSDDLYGGGGEDRLEGGDGDDELWGYGSSDVLMGGKGADVLDAGDGDDVLCDQRLESASPYTCAGTNTFFGGAGTDRAWSALSNGCQYVGALDGNGSVEIARPPQLAWDLDGVLDPVVGYEEAGTPWPECL